MTIRGTYREISAGRHQRVLDLIQDPSAAPENDVTPMGPGFCRDTVGVNGETSTGQQSDLDFVLLVVVGVFRQVTDELRVDRLTFAEAFRNVHFLVAHLDKVNRCDCVVCFGID